jgi:hypothetical protein
LEHQILIKRGIKRASFHHACHGQTPEKLSQCVWPLFTTVR